MINPKQQCLVLLYFYIPVFTSVKNCDIFVCFVGAFPEQSLYVRLVAATGDFGIELELYF
jgi:hypothetical protein